MNTFLFWVEAGAGFAVGLCLTMLVIEEIYYRISMYFWRKK